MKIRSLLSPFGETGSNKLLEINRLAMLIIYIRKTFVNYGVLVVSEESVRIAFLHAAFNDLDILRCDVSNAYLNASCREKLWVKAGLKFALDEGSAMMV